MLQFQCQCRYVFSLEESMAGSMVQCPRCRRLCDVPQLGEIANIEDDGTLRMKDDAPPTSEAGRAQELARSFSRDRADETGQEIDLRLSEEEISLAGTTAEPGGDDESYRRIAPTYDPETGDLVRPIEVQREADLARPVIPMAKPALAYEVGVAHLSETRNPLFLELLMPHNAFVIFCAFLVLIIAQVSVLLLLPLVLAGFSPLILPLPVITVLIAHFGNVIDDIGMQDRDELPRILRDVSLSDDFFGPLRKMIFCLGVCFGPALFSLNTFDFKRPNDLMLLGMFYAAGAVLLPALLITVLLSQDVGNFRPDRILAVAMKCGWQYLPVAAAWAAGIALFTWSLYGPAILPENVLLTYPWLRAVFNHWLMLYPAAILSLYLLHYAGWRTGLLYRKHRADFPWVGQRYERVGPRFPKQRAVQKARPAAEMDEMRRADQKRRTENNASLDQVADDRSTWG